VLICGRIFLKEGRLFRPFPESCDVRCRGYSLPPQRRICDSGADISFNGIPEKLYEHYGIEIPYSAVRYLTERHAEAVKENGYYETAIPGTDGVGCIVCGTDGTMIPTVTAEESADAGNLSDRRKTRRCGWKEAGLMPAHAKGSVSPVSGCTPGGPDEAGDGLPDCAIHAGTGQKTEVHRMGDGAAWIVNRTDRVSGSQADYLIDFYHLCGYLSRASESCGSDNPSAFFYRHKQLMEEGKVSEVIDGLKPCSGSDSVPAAEAPVGCCLSYIMKRPGQSDYKRASENDLPTGSGEIGSAHRYIIQKRLKIAGAWRKENNAGNMLFLRILRANGRWENYWEKADRI